MRIISRVAVLKFLDATVGFALCWAAGYARFLFSRDAGTPRAEVGPLRRVLVVRPGGMGDMILLLPALAWLRARHPAAEILLACERRNMEVLRLAGLADRAIAYDAAPFRLLRALRTSRFDAAVDTEQFHYFSALMAFLSGAPVRIGFKVNPGRNLLYTHLVSYSLDGYEGDQFMRLLAPLGASDAPPGAVDGILRDRAPDVSILAPADGETLRGMRPYAVLAPGTPIPHKRWDARRFGELARLLGERWGLGVVVVGGDDAAPSGNAVVEASVRNGRAAVSWAGRLTLAQTAAVLRESRLLVGVDTGLAHLAAAMGVPTVVIFGPTDHLKWGIDDARHAVVRKPAACAPCFIFGYHRPCRDLICMRAVEAADVAAACGRLLSSIP
jgi:ADP-heptose:LPS heptosyltransferase